MRYVITVYAPGGKMSYTWGHEHEPGDHFMGGVDYCLATLKHSGMIDDYKLKPVEILEGLEWPQEAENGR